MSRPDLPRYLFQAGWLAFYVWLAVSFHGWVEQVRVDPASVGPRPAAVDGFLPISGLLGLRHWAASGDLHPVHPAAALILLAALLSALLLKRGFCSWVCPVFPAFEGLWRLGRRLWGRTFVPPFWVDLPLRAVKYLLLGYFLYAILWLMSPAQVGAFLASAYHKLADVRLLQFFLDPGGMTLVILALLGIAGLFVQMPWCRYACPYGALLGLLSLFSVVKVRRSERLCVRCGACSSHCPAWLAVMHSRTVRSPECFACYRCVQVCPAPGAVTLRAWNRLAVPAWLLGVLLLALFLAADFYGRATGHWQSRVSPMEISILLGG